MIQNLLVAAVTRSLVLVKKRKSSHPCGLWCIWPLPPGIRKMPPLFSLRIDI